MTRRTSATDTDPPRSRNRACCRFRRWALLSSAETPSLTCCSTTAGGSIVAAPTEKLTTGRGTCSRGSVIGHVMDHVRTRSKQGPETSVLHNHPLPSFVIEPQAGGNLTMTLVISRGLSYGSEDTGHRCVALLVLRLSQITKGYMVKKGIYTIRDRERFLECLTEIRLRVFVGYAWKMVGTA